MAGAPFDEFGTGSYGDQYPSYGSAPSAAPVAFGFGRAPAAPMHDPMHDPMRGPGDNMRGAGNGCLSHGRDSHSMAMEALRDRYARSPPDGWQDSNPMPPPAMRDRFARRPEDGVWQDSNPMPPPAPRPCGIEPEASDFDRNLWEPCSYRYGLEGLLRCRKAMMPIEKPREVAHLKFLICPSAMGEGQNWSNDAHDPNRIRAGGRGSAKGKGKDRSGKGGPSGRYVQDMGRTEILQNGTGKGTWWRNVGDSPVIVRDSFSLLGKELYQVPAGHFVCQNGFVEVFVSGQAQGLQRMPVQPRGWVTVDAVSVGGPRYLEVVTCPRWRVAWSSGTNKGDIVVRESVSLDSREVAVLLCGTLVEQAGPTETLEDGIIRMPISFSEREAGEPSSGSAKQTSGWVTCDATSQGGPKFFEPLSSEEDPPRPNNRPQQQQTPQQQQQQQQQPQRGPPQQQHMQQQQGQQQPLIRQLPPDAMQRPGGPGMPGPGGPMMPNLGQQGGPPQPLIPGNRDQRNNWPVPPSNLGMGGPCGGPGVNGPSGSSGPMVQRGGPMPHQHQQPSTTWEKNRLWRAINLEPSNMRQLAVTTETTPFAPGTGKVPPDEIVVRWLQNGDIVEQVGHSKKVRGYMVMPVKVVSVAADPGTDYSKEEGWVVRRAVDKTRDHGEGAALFEELDARRETRRTERHARQSQYSPGEAIAL